MGRTPTSQGASRSQNDPGESNNPQRSNDSGYEAHLWTSLNQIFERLGKIEAKIDQVGADQKELKTKVESHDKMILRAIYSVGGFVALAVVIWFLYENVLKDHLKIV